MEAARIRRVREVERVPGAEDVRPVHRFGARLDVVDGAEMKEVLELALELAQVARVDPELRF
jgi:hypothetical protein